MKIELNLKPCPFCGGDDLTVDTFVRNAVNGYHIDYLSVCCNKCGTKVTLKNHDCFHKFKEADPVDIWNMRTEV